MFALHDSNLILQISAAVNLISNIFKYSMEFFAINLGLIILTVIADGQLPKLLEHLF